MNVHIRTLVKPTKNIIALLVFVAAIGIAGLILFLYQRPSSVVPKPTSPPIKSYADFSPSVQLADIIHRGGFQFSPIASSRNIAQLPVAGLDFFVIAGAEGVQYSAATFKDETSGYVITYHMTGDAVLAPYMEMRRVAFKSTWNLVWGTRVDNAAVVDFENEMYQARVTFLGSQNGQTDIIVTTHSK